MSILSIRLSQCLIAIAAAIASHPAMAQERYPSRPIEFIVPWGPGGGSDQTARKIAKLLEVELKVSVPVINVPGATGNTGMAKLLAAPADGYRIAILPTESYALLATQPPKWSMKDFVFLAMMITLPGGFYVADNRFSDWKALEQQARSKPLKVAIAGFGGTEDIIVNFLASKGLHLIGVPFNNPGERYAAALGGHVDVLSSPAGNIKSLVDGKQVRPVIFFDDKRLAEFPDVPVAKELGYDITLAQRRGVIIKAGTDPAKVAKLSNALARVAATDEYKAFLRDAVASQASYAPTPEATALVERDLADIRAIVRSSKR